MPRLCRLIYCLGTVLGAHAVLIVAPLAAESPPTIEYNRDIRPLLSDKCFRCHGPDAAHREANLRLDRREDALAAREGSRAIVPGDSAASELFRRISSANADLRMPPAESGSVLSAKEIDLLRRWIDQGAEYQPHWSFIPPRAGPLPQIHNRDWPRNGIDNFVLADLERQHQKPSPEASRETLLRRVTLDLTGLPPTPAELDAFLADKSAGAYERVVDRLLQSPRYGERMALDWLDAARYADTNGYYTDSERQAWPWREWVIKAFNANQPFDQFTIEQLAGDLLPGATTQQRIATGFNRNHMVSNESGIIDEEYRVGYVVDRVDTTATVWLGLTMGCARCHDHKYDPISQREYYEFFAWFNSIQEAGLVKELSPNSAPPSLSLPTAEQEQRLADLRTARKECDAQLQAFKPALNKGLAEWQSTALDSLPPIATAGSVAHFDFNDDVADRGPSKFDSNTVGKLQFVPGVKGRAASFDSTQYVEFDAQRSVERDSPFSLAIWIKPGSGPQGCVVSKMNSNAQSRGFEIIWYKSQPRINLVHEWGRNAIEIVAKEKFSGNLWRHLAVTYDGSGQAAGLNVYIDGTPSPVDIRRDNLSGSVASNEPWRIAWKGTGIGFEGDVDEFRLYDRPLTAEEVEGMYWRDHLSGAIETPPADRTRQQTERLETYYITHHGSDELRQLSQRTAQLRGEEDAVVKTILSTSVMQEMEQPRQTFILTRGQYDQPAQSVTPGVPESLGPLSPAMPRNRLGLARWLVSPTNPLTARVAVNRYWQHVFGEGLVRTVNDFGLQGEQPSHPQLLDWLAVRFVQSGWNGKEMMKLLVTSATYRQSSNFTVELRRHDPENRWLARGPRYRLPAELLRDQALSLGGLLVERIGGPSVKPYQPPGLWEAVSYNGDQSYEPDHGDGLYRRSLYTFWKRQSPPPDILTFDGPTREVCTVRRARTNTPLQALVLLNDITYIEAARGMATRMLPAGGKDDTDRLRYGFRCATGRLPKVTEVDALKKLYQRQLAVFRASPQSADKLLRVGDSPMDVLLDPCELAAWTMVANVLLNLDEVVTQH